MKRKIKRIVQKWVRTTVVLNYPLVLHDLMKNGFGYWVMEPRQCLLLFQILWCYVQLPKMLFFIQILTGKLYLTRIVRDWKIWLPQKCLVGLAWCLRWGICKNWAHDAPGLGLRAQESSKTGFLLWALSAVPAYRFFSKLIIQSCLTYILCQ